jgi:hypothetical protein
VKKAIALVKDYGSLVELVKDIDAQAANYAERHAFLERQIRAHDEQAIKDADKCRQIIIDTLKGEKLLPEDFDPEKNHVTIRDGVVFLHDGKRRDCPGHMDGHPLFDALRKMGGQIIGVEIERPEP